jgi:oxalate decarboxylase/phosphoglucose isomerase-like protein (cupin superfamily)/CRP-like cAMP-binding protein
VEFPSGIPRSIQGLAPDGCEFLLVFDDGAFSEFSTFLPSSWVAHTPVEVLAKNFGVSEALKPIPLHELYRLQAPVPDPLADDRSAAMSRAGNTPQSFKFALLEREPVFSSPHGEVRIADSRTFPIASTIAAAHAVVRPRAMREMHWHPNADEWQYYIGGEGRMGVFAGGQNIRTKEFKVGDVGYVPRGMGYPIESTGQGDLVFLEVFASSYYSSISLSQWLRHAPPELVKAHFNLIRQHSMPFRAAGPPRRQAAAPRATIPNGKNTRKHRRHGSPVTPHAFSAAFSQSADGAAARRPYHRTYFWNLTPCGDFPNVEYVSICPRIIMSEPVPKNRLLAGLPKVEWSRLRALCESVDLESGQLLFEEGSPLDHLYFPQTGVISTMTTFEDGTHSESTATGCEGVVNVATLIGDRQAAFRNVVQIPGSAIRVPARAVRSGGLDLPQLAHGLRAYTRAFVIQILQSVACNSTHNVKQRSARWLLMCHDRVAGDEFALTQEFLAEMLGVSRTAVGAVTRRFARAGWLSYRRGRMTITDRQALRHAACECYDRVRAEYDRLLPGSFFRH